MKIFVLLVSIFLSYTGIYSQGIEIYSLNGRYKVIIEGRKDEGFIGDQLVSLFHENIKVWTKRIPAELLMYPIVSNIGEVAIPHYSYIIFYDSLGKEKHSYKLGINETIWDETIANPIHGFSPSGDRYYVICNNFILCLDNSVRQIWRDTMDYQCQPRTLQFYKDKVLFSYWTTGDTISDIICVYDRDDARVWQHTSAQPLKILIDSTNGKLIAVDKYQSVKFDLENKNAP